MVRHPRRKRGHSPLGRVFRWSIAAAAAAALLTVYALWWSAGPKPGPHEIIVAEGSTLTTVAAQLDRQGAIPGSARTFRAMAKLFGSSDPIQAGEFQIPAGMSASRILDLLQHGKPLQRLVTVTEGMPSIIVAEKLAANRYLTGPLPPMVEGSLLPDSYSYDRGDTRAEVVKRMQQAMVKTLAELWPKNSGRCPLASKEDAVTLASIVE
jgi:UPF0755 protein